MHFMSALFSGFHQPTGGVEAAIPGQNSNFHIERTYTLISGNYGYSPSLSCGNNGGLNLLPPSTKDLLLSTMYRFFNAPRPKSIRKRMFSRSVRVISAVKV